MIFVIGAKEDFVMFDCNLIINSDKELKKVFGLSQITKVVSCERREVSRYFKNFNDTSEILICKCGVYKEYHCFLTLINKPKGNYPNTLHNPFGPASIIIYPNYIRIFYENNGKAHRPFFSAKKIYDTEGNLIEEVFFMNGKMHNPVGPAHRIRNRIETEWHNRFFINGIQITLNEFCNRYEKRLCLNAIQ